MTIRILIVDDQQLIRHALRTLIEGEPDLSIVGEASDVRELINLTRQLQPDLVLLDLAVCLSHYTEVLADLQRCRPPVRTVILTMIEEEEVIVQALLAGATGYLLKSIVPQDLLQALRAAAAGGTPLHPRIASQVLRRLNRPPTKPEPYTMLTAREQEILHLLAQGYSNQEIASRLVITQFTVRSHICRILKKLNLANRTQAALYHIHRQRVGVAPSEPLIRSHV
jgi:NarL family two-component system response regulator LiaR